jgi:hypothetical protein
MAVSHIGVGFVLVYSDCRVETIGRSEDYEPAAGRGAFLRQFGDDEAGQQVNVLREERNEHLEGEALGQWTLDLQPGVAEGLEEVVEEKLRFPLLIVSDVLFHPGDEFGRFLLTWHGGVLREAGPVVSRDVKPGRFIPL